MFKAAIVLLSAVIGWLLFERWNLERCLSEARAEATLCKLNADSKFEQLRTELQEKSNELDHLRRAHARCDEHYQELQRVSDLIHDENMELHQQIEQMEAQDRNNYWYEQWRVAAGINKKEADAQREG